MLGSCAPMLKAPRPTASKQLPAVTLQARRADHAAAVAALSSEEAFERSAKLRAGDAPTLGELSSKLQALGVKASTGAAADALEAAATLRTTVRNGSGGAAASMSHLEMHNQN